MRPGLQRLLAATGLASLLLGSLPAPAADPLASLDYRVVGTQLTVTPANLAIPKGIIGSVRVTFTGPTNSLGNAYVEAILRGPSFGWPGESTLAAAAASARRGLSTRQHPARGRRDGGGEDGRDSGLRAGTRVR